MIRHLLSQALDTLTLARTVIAQALQIEYLTKLSNALEGELARSDERAESKDTARRYAVEVAKGWHERARDKDRKLVVLQADHVAAIVAMRRKHDNAIADLDTQRTLSSERFKRLIDAYIRADMLRQDIERLESLAEDRRLALVAASMEETALRAAIEDLKAAGLVVTYSAPPMVKTADLLRAIDDAERAYLTASGLRPGGESLADGWIDPVTGRTWSHTSAVAIQRRCDADDDPLIGTGS